MSYQELNRVDQLRHDVDEIDNYKFKLYYLNTIDSLVISNKLLSDKEKIYMLEESNVVLAEIIDYLLRD